MKTMYGTYSNLRDTKGRLISKIYYRFYSNCNNGGTGKPHQGAKERQRRVAQMRAQGI